MCLLGGTCRCQPARQQEQQHILRLLLLLVLLPLQVHSVDSHRLALALAGRNKLAPMIREAILSEVGITSGNVRLTNLL